MDNCSTNTWLHVFKFFMILSHSWHVRYVCGNYLHVLRFHESRRYHQIAFATTLGPFGYILEYNAWWIIRTLNQFNFLPRNFDLLQYSGAHIRIYVIVSLPFVSTSFLMYSSNWRHMKSFLKHQFFKNFIISQYWGEEVIKKFLETYKFHNWNHFL